MHGSADASRELYSLRSSGRLLLQCRHGNALSGGLLLSANSRNVPIECPENYICQSGYTVPVKCPAGTSVRKPGAGAIVILAAMLVWLVRKLRLKRLKEFSSAVRSIRK